MMERKTYTEVTSPKSCTSANSAIPAYSVSLYFYSEKGYPRRSITLDPHL